MESYKLTGINLEVAKEDLGTLSFNVASLKAEAIGDGWRIPTIVELEYLYNLSKIGLLSFKPERYWSSSVPAEGNAIERYCLFFNNGWRTGFTKFNTFRIRLVRDL
jgi:hypothetical protein